ncbi:unnamed protein product, partial [Mesorhabditis spiculigera]
MFGGFEASNLLSPFYAGWLINNGPHADKSAIGMLLMANVFLDQSKDVHNFDVKGDLKRCVSQDEKKAAKPTERDQEFKDQYRKGIILSAHDQGRVMETLEQELDMLVSHAIYDYSLLSSINHKARAAKPGFTQHEGVAKEVEVKMRLVDICSWMSPRPPTASTSFCSESPRSCSRIRNGAQNIVRGWASKKRVGIVNFLSIANIATDCGDRNTKCRKATVITNLYHLTSRHGWAVEQQEQEQGPEEQQEGREEPYEHEHEDHYHLREPRNTLHGTIQRGEAIESVVVKMKLVDVLLRDAANVVSRKHEFLLGVADFVFPDPNWREGYRQRMEIQDNAGRMNIKGQGPSQKSN